MARQSRISTRTRTRALLLTAVAFAAAGLGCASNQPEVGVAFDPLTPFPAAATFAWDDRHNKIPDDPRITSLEIGPVIKEAFGVVMAERGWNAAGPEGPQYLASYQLGINTWHGPNESLSVGSLSITLVEAVSKRRVWMGFGRAEVEIGLTPEHRQQRFRTIFRKLLKDFPPNQRR